jgi:hypothetical protein
MENVIQLVTLTKYEATKYESMKYEALNLCAAMCAPSGQRHRAHRQDSLQR